MKKICLTAVAATAMLFSVQNATAQVYEEGTETTQETQKEEMEQIEVAELPDEIQQSVERDFQGATVSEAYFKEKDGEKKYKIVLTTLQGETKELYADAQGNWIDKKDKAGK
ncbi:hypothetical protein [Salinimicrobium sp. GXAS 041]|uniref:hypothetical protein n=1 Tax=Salinimicrobium sp. GXAS 041 TaxID=3400806 RepID=UPI003C77A830